MLLTREGEGPRGEAQWQLVGSIASSTSSARWRDWIPGEMGHMGHLSELWTVRATWAKSYKHATQTFTENILKSQVLSVIYKFRKWDIYAWDLVIWYTWLILGNGTVTEEGGSQMK